MTTNRCVKQTKIKAKKVAHVAQVGTKWHPQAAASTCSSSQVRRHAAGELERRRHQRPRERAVVTLTMDIYGEAYHRSISQNHQQAAFWESYAQNLRELNFKVFSDNMKVSSLIPIGSRMLFRGVLIHTNEIMVALGANYFAKCSAVQADVLRHHRIKDAEENLHVLQKEREYLESQLTLSTNTVLQEVGSEIIEPYSDEEERIWRLKHRENMKKYKKENKGEFSHINDEKLWNRLEELELKEETENEYSNLTNTLDSISSPVSSNSHKNDTNSIDEVKDYVESHLKNINKSKSIKDRIIELKTQISNMKSKEVIQCQTESDFDKRLIELEELEALKDELDRLEEESDSDVDEEVSSASTKKSIYFENDNDDNCVEINFQHSKEIPDSRSYEKDVGIMKPSDIYTAYPENFEGRKKIVSILKKTQNSNPISAPEKVEIIKKETVIEHRQSKLVNVVGDIIENKAIDKNDNTDKVVVKRPISKFKAMRMQKSSQ